jgi:hypothetical protein
METSMENSASRKRQPYLARFMERHCLNNRFLPKACRNDVLGNSSFRHACGFRQASLAEGSKKTREIPAKSSLE